MFKGKNTAASSLGVYCSTMTVKVSSTGNNILFVAHSDATVQHPGYKFDFKFERK